jgi:flagellar hook-basal body complex protein FliE
MSVQTITVTPSPEAGAFDGIANGDSSGSDGVVDAGHDADAQSMQAIAGGGNLTDVVTSVSKAELALQTTLAIRDRAVQAYQDVMRMAI